MQESEFEIAQLRLCDRTRHAYEVKQRPNTHLRGKPKKIIAMAKQKHLA